MAHDWFITQDGKERGPFTAQQLKEMAAKGDLAPDDLVRRSDMQAPCKASGIKGLLATGGLNSTRRPSPPAPEAEAPQFTEKKGGSTKKLLLIASVIGGACLVLCCGGFGVVATLGMRMEQTTRKQFAEGDALWDKGDKSGAVEKYRGILDNRQVALLREDQRTRLYGRLIDHEYEKGDAAAGKALLDRALNDKIMPDLRHPQAKEAMAAVESERAREQARKEGTQTNFTLEEQVSYIVKNDFGLTADEGEAVLHPGKEIKGLVYEEKENVQFVGGKLAPRKEKTGTLRKGRDELKRLLVGPLDTDRRDPKIDYSKKRIHSIEAVVRDGDKHHVKTRWDFVDVISKHCRILKHPITITEYDGTNWRIGEREIRFYVGGQKEYECYGKSNSGSIDPRCYDKRDRYWSETGKEIDQKSYCEARWGKDWQRQLFESEARAGRRNVENLLESMKRNGQLTDEQAKKIISDMERAGTLAPK